MKSLFHLLIICIIYISFTAESNSGFQDSKYVILQSEDSKISEQILNQSARIISERLKTCGYMTNINVMTDKHQLSVSLPDKTDLSDIEGLLTSKGELGFYETLSLKEIKGKTLMNRTDIESIKASDRSGENMIINIRFKPESAGKWADATKNNIGKPIAITLDDKIFYNPVVREVIKGGLCEISGSFTKKEIDRFLALVNNDPLPVSFIIQQ